MKARYLVQEQAIEMMNAVSKDMSQQFMAAACYAVHLRYADKTESYRKKKVKEIFNDINEVFQMPPVCGKTLEGLQIVDFIAETYGIDFSDIKISIETKEECKRRNP